MSFVTRIFETHIGVADLPRAQQFYERIMGLKLGRYEEDRRVAFYWAGGSNVSLLGLWERPEPIMAQHYAFQIALEDFPAAIDHLQRHGITPYNFLKDGTTEPMVFCWMPAVSIYYRDPDGHELEYIAPLKGAPIPDGGIVSLEGWNAK